jgi:tRNA A37 threonylcarbamoyladenosine modification protein TsaB
LQAFSADATPLAPPGVFALADAGAAIPREAVLAFGSGAEALAEEARRQDRHIRHALADLVPEAADLARLAQGRPADACPPAPLYLRAPDAKPQTGKSLGRAQH